MQRKQQNKALSSPAGGARTWPGQLSGNLTLAGLGISIFALFTISQRIIDLYPQLRLYQIAIVGLALFLIFFSVFDLQFVRNKITIIDLLWFPGIAMVLAYIYFTNMNIFEIFYYLSAYALLVLAKLGIKEIGPSFLFFKYGAVIYALGTITQFISPETFNNFILSITDRYSEEALARRVQRNYYPGFGINRTAVGAFFISVGLGNLVSFWNNKNKFKLYSDIAIFIILFAALLITGKRSLFLWTVVALPFIYIVLAKAEERLKRVLQVFLFVLGASGLLYIVHYTLSLEFLVRLEDLVLGTMTGDIPGSIETRFEHYRDAWAIFLDNPVFGAGWKQFRVLTEGFYSTDYHTHNVYLQLLCETGIFGFTVIMGPVVYTYYKTYSMLNSLLNEPKTINPLWKNGLIFSFYCQTIFLLYSLSDSPFYHLQYIFVYFFALAIANSYLVFEKNSMIKNEPLDK